MRKEKRDRKQMVISYRRRRERHTKEREEKDRDGKPSRRSTNKAAGQKERKRAHSISTD